MRTFLADALLWIFKRWPILVAGVAEWYEPSGERWSVTYWHCQDCDATQERKP